MNTKEPGYRMFWQEITYRTLYYTRRTVLYMWRPKVIFGRNINVNSLPANVNTPRKTFGWCSMLRTRSTKDGRKNRDSAMPLKRSPPNGSKDFEIWTKGFVAMLLLMVIGCAISWVVGNMSGWEQRIHYEAMQCADKFSLCP